MPTTIHFNGRGQAPVSELLERLATDRLDPACVRRGVARNVPGRMGYVHFYGNFESVSWAFSVVTDDADLVGQLIAAIKVNSPLSA